MKSLFDRTKVYVYLDKPDMATDGADGAVSVLSVSGEGLFVPQNTEYTDLEGLVAAYRQNGGELVLELSDAAGEDAQNHLLLCLTRYEMFSRVILVSRFHRMLDTMKQAEPQVRVSPLCDADMVRPWIYAAYMGAPAYCADAKEILLGADAWGCPDVDRAHNANVCIFAEHAEDADTVRALVRVGCDAVFTHDPAMARELVW